MKVSKTNIDLAAVEEQDTRCAEMEQALQIDAGGMSTRHWTLQFQADGDKPGGSKFDEE